MSEDQKELTVDDLTDEERQPCEVWTRVMGYHRPISSFNIGKKAEYQERKSFTLKGQSKWIIILKKLLLKN